MCPESGNSLWNLVLSAPFAQCFVQAFVSADYYPEPLCPVCGLLQMLASARNGVDLFAGNFQPNGSEENRKKKWT